MSGRGTLTCIAAAILLTAGTLSAQGHGGPGGPGGGRFAEQPGQRQFQGIGMEQLARFRTMFRGLDLSEAQEEEIRSIIEEAGEEIRTIMEASGVPDGRDTFMEVFTSPTLTVRDLEDTIGRFDDVRAEIRAVVFRAIVDIHGVLTPEQLERLAAMHEEHRAGHHPR